MVTTRGFLAAGGWAGFLLWILLGVGEVLGIFALLMILRGSDVHEALRVLDPTITQAVRTVEHPAVTWVMLALSKLGSFQAMAPVVLALSVWLIARKRWRDGVALAVAMVGARLLESNLKLWARRPRPVVDWALWHETTFAFPSGHALTAVVFWGMLTYLAWHLARGRVTRGVLMSAAASLAVLTGMSRIYLGVHHPTDVLAGFLLGGIWLAMMLLATRALHGGRTNV